ncbi:peptidoglycan recognition protein, partial [Streptomyces chartreusis]|uniref:peptidoglycan recognition protein family protein n=1 Tax=Streptomyces chartreusis TaxID=1969 RepID=UPI00380B9899
MHTLRLKDRGLGRKGLAKQGTDRFSAVVLTWTDPGARAKGTPEVRTRDIETGEWSGWQKVTVEPGQADGAEGARAALRGGTESVWTGDSDGVEVRLVSADGSEAAGQPAGMDVKLLDPGTDPKSQPQLAAFSAGEAKTVTRQSSQRAHAMQTVRTHARPASLLSAAPASRPSTVVKPPVITQAEWGASTDYDGTPEYGTEIKAAVVHHTGVNSDNTLSCGESRARMRTIQQEHFARGYFDIGYNFVVDKCGQIFEGRSGGMDLPVRGAHDVGFNTDTVGISYIGNFESARPSRAGLDAIARIVAWKFGMYGIDPTGKVTLTSGMDQGVDGNKIPMGQSVTLPRVFGHRDTNSTACPGANLYPKLTRIA